MSEPRRGPAGARLSLFFLAAMACTEAGTLVPPSLENAESALLLSPSRPAFAHAVELGRDGPGRIEFPEHVEGEPLLLSLYTCSLAELELPAGPVPLRAGSGRAFPMGERSYRLDADGEDGWTSIESAALQLELDPLRLDEDEPPPCNDFPLVSPTQLHVVPGVAGYLSLIALDDETGLLSSTESLHWIRADLSLELVEHPLLESSSGAITHGEPGEAVIIPSRGPMLRGHPDRGLTVYAPGPPNATDRMHVARSPPGLVPVEFLVLSPLGLSRFDGEAWTVLDETTAASDPFTRHLALWLGPNEAVFLPTDPESNPRLLHWHDGRFTEIITPDIPRSLARLEDRRILVGSEGGLLFEVDLEAGLVEARLEGWSRPMRPIWVILPLEESFFLSGWSGLTNELDPNRVFCSSSGFTPELSGASVSAADLIGPKREILGAGGAGRGGDTTRIGVFRLGRSSAKPDRCPTL